MRKGLIAAVLAAVWAPAAQACGAAVSPTGVQAPLTVTYAALCDSTTYHWTFGDGTTADGKTVAHTFAAGRFAGTLTTDAGVESLRPVVATALTLRAPRTAAYREPVTLSGTGAAGLGTVRIYRGDSFVTFARVRAGGAFEAKVRLLGPGPYTARASGAVSAPSTVLVKPLLEARVVGTPTVGRPLTVVATLKPAAAGSLRVRVGQRSKQGHTVTLRLDTSRPARYRVRVQATGAAGYLKAARILDVPVVFPELGVGATGASVLELQRRLAALGYASLGVDGSYGQDTFDSVLAFQKVERLPRTGTADASLWTRLAHAATPKPRYGGTDHVEVDKTRQVLFLVRDARVASIVPVSTAGLAGYHTPEGRFAVYRKVAGLDDGPLGPLYDPSYFTGGYAIHGSPSVPAYPASHGCVRVPMWISWRLYTIIPYGEPVYVYS